ncbi:MAG TPA: hypothetical protein V6D17_01910 [Candidatus Obscuribacterales bacterium]
MAKNENMQAEECGDARSNFASRLLSQALNERKKPAATKRSWFEFGRPQIPQEEVNEKELAVSGKR